jgi:hypothetical protein
VQDVAGVGALGQAGGGPEAQQLPALRGRGVIGQQEQAGVREPLVELSQFGRVVERPEVEDRHVSRFSAESGVQTVLGDAGRDQTEAVVLLDQGLQAEADDVLELGHRHIDRGAAQERHDDRLPMRQVRLLPGEAYLTHFHHPTSPEFPPA